MLISKELAQLAHLMRVSADTARLIAHGRGVDAKKILDIAGRTDDLAAELEIYSHSTSTRAFRSSDFAD